MITIKYRILQYLTPLGRNPYKEWLTTLSRDIELRIETRIIRFEYGNFGDCKSIDEIYEARFKFGSGYRVYFGLYKNTIVILLCGGDKKTQRSDIIKAKKHWKDYKNRQKLWQEDL